MRLLRQIAEIAIKTARAGVPPIDDIVQPLGAFAFRRRLANLAELLFEPETVVEREIYRVKVRAAPDRDGLILFDVKLHADALKLGFVKLEDAPPDVLCDALRHGAIQYFFG